MLHPEITCACGGYKDYRAAMCNRCERTMRRSSNPDKARVMASQGMSDEQIAERLGAASVNVVRVWHSRARARRSGARA